MGKKTVREFGGERKRTTAAERLKYDLQNKAVKDALAALIRTLELCETQFERAELMLGSAASIWAESIQCVLKKYPDHVQLRHMLLDMCEYHMSLVEKDLADRGMIKKEEEE